TKFQTDSAYLDDRPTAPLRFLAEANLTQVINREERNVDKGEAAGELRDRIKQIFGGSNFEMGPFPGVPGDISDDVGDGKPKLAVISHDALDVGADLAEVPELVRKLFERKGSQGEGLRGMQNNLAFLVADEARIGDMKQMMFRRLALRELKR